MTISISPVAHTPAAHCLSGAQEEAALGDAVRLPTGSLLRDDSLLRFKAEHARLLRRVEDHYQQTDVRLREALQEHRYADVARDLTTVLEKMAEAGVDSVIFSESGETFHVRVAAILQHVSSSAKAEVDESKQLMEKLCDLCRAAPPSEDEVVGFKARLQWLQELKTQVGSVLKGKVTKLNLIARSSSLSLGPADLFTGPAQGAAAGTAAELRGGEASPATTRGAKRRRQKDKDTAAAEEAWDTVLYQLLQSAELELTNSLEQYARACRERCLLSLGEEPKPRAEDVVTFLKTLSVCKELDPVFAAARPDSGTLLFAEERKAVNAKVKEKFLEVRDTCSRQVRGSQMAEAHSTLEIAKSMLVLRDEFAGDALKMDDAVEEMRADFEQKSGAFSQSVSKAINEERFGELNTLLLGYRDLPGAAQQEEFSNALNSLVERGDDKYTLATQVIASINDDTRGRTEFPPSMEQMAAALRWIEGSRCVFCVGSMRERERRRVRT